MHSIQTNCQNLSFTTHQQSLLPFYYKQAADLASSLAVKRVDLQL